MTKHFFSNHLHIENFTIHIITICINLKFKLSRNTHAKIDNRFFYYYKIFKKNHIEILNQFRHNKPSDTMPIVDWHLSVQNPPSATKQEAPSPNAITHRLIDTIAFRICANFRFRSWLVCIRRP